MRPRTLALCASLALLAACHRTEEPGPRAQDQLGIAVESVRRSGANRIVDVRYRVVDAEKATPVLSRAVKPYLVDEATGQQFRVPSFPKVGALRQAGRAVVGRTYFVLFSDPAGQLKPGAKVALVIGDVSVSGLTVQ